MTQSNSMTKKVSDSVLTMTELVLPNHTNQLGNLLGGQLMHWIDICAALSASKHSRRICVTASVDRIDFHHPIKLGEVVVINAQVTRVFNTSLEVWVTVKASSHMEGTERLSNSAFFTFVSVDENVKPVKIPPIEPETEDEKRRYKEAMERRQIRLQTRTYH